MCAHKNCVIVLGKKHECAECVLEERDKALKVLERVRQDINWMLNNERLLNAFVFNYLHKFLEEAERRSTS